MGMSFYNAIFGFDPGCIFFLPMIGRSRDDFPIFRDCFLSDPSKRTIEIMTRTGGFNREAFADENQQITQFDGYLSDRDDKFDPTYAYWEFAIPEKWHADFDAIVRRGYAALSGEYKAMIFEAHPSLKEKIESELAAFAEQKGGA